MFAALKAKIQGLRTLIVSGVLTAVGAAQTFGVIDITPLVRLFVKDDNQLGAVMVVLALVFGYLRYITRTPVGRGDHCEDERADETPRKNVDGGM